MKTVTLTPQYIRKVAATYRFLKQGGTLPAQELTTLALAASRCLRAHDSQLLQLSSDVVLPIEAVVRMLTVVRSQATEQLKSLKEQEQERVPVPEDFVSSNSPEVKSLLRRAKERVAALFRTPATV